jgi:hypothetical protein
MNGEHKVRMKIPGYQVSLQSPAYLNTSAIIFRFIGIDLLACNCLVFA